MIQNGNEKQTRVLNDDVSGFKKKIRCSCYNVSNMVEKAIFGLLGSNISKSWRIGKVWTTDLFLGHQNSSGWSAPVFRYKNKFIFDGLCCYLIGSCKLKKSGWQNKHENLNIFSGE